MGHNVVFFILWRLSIKAVDGRNMVRRIDIVVYGDAHIICMPQGNLTTLPHIEKEKNFACFVLFSLILLSLFNF